MGVGDVEEQPLQSKVRSLVLPAVVSSWLCCQYCVCIVQTAYNHHISGACMSNRTECLHFPESNMQSTLAILSPDTGVLIMHDR